MKETVKPDERELEDSLLFVCDEAACRKDVMFYEVFSRDDRWDIIRAVIQAARTHDESTP